MSKKSTPLLLISLSGNPYEVTTKLRGSAFVLEVATNLDQLLFLNRELSSCIYLLRTDATSLKIWHDLCLKHQVDPLGTILICEHEDRGEEIFFSAGGLVTWSMQTEVSGLERRVEAIERISMSPLYLASKNFEGTAVSRNVPDSLLNNGTAFDALEADPHSMVGLFAYKNRQLVNPELRSKGVVLGFGRCQLDASNQLLICGSKKIHLSPVQLRILSALAENLDQVLHREKLKQLVWPGEKIASRSIDAHVSKLKRLIPELQENLVNIYGKGYLLSSSKVEMNHRPEKKTA